MVIAALLSAIGIIIPMFAPKIVIPPASYTLASHVPIFLAMFISPVVAIFVSLITTVGFFIAGFPQIIVIRALTHVIFATIGAFVLKKNGNILRNIKSASIFAFLISVVHALAEVFVVSYFYFGKGVTDLYYQNGYVATVILLIGIGGLIHSLIDFSIAMFVWKPLQYVINMPVSARVKAK